MKRKMFKAAGLIAGLLLAGCSVAPERTDPYALPEYAEPDSQCRDIAGHYSAYPREWVEAKSGRRPLLALTLLQSTTLTEATTVSLAIGGDGSLVVNAEDHQGKRLATTRYAADSGVYDCDDGVLEFYPAESGTAQAGLPWETVVLRKTTDGSLMLRKGGLFSGLAFMVFPMYVSTDDWYLFKPVER